LDPAHRTAQQNIRFLIKLPLVVVGVVFFLALGNAPSWLHSLAALGPIGWLALAVTAAGLVAVTARLGAAWCRRAPAPVALTVRDVLTLRRLRRPEPLMPGAVRRAWTGVAVAALVGLGGITSALQPERPGERTTGLVTAAIAVLVGGPTVRRLRRHHRKR